MNRCRFCESPLSRTVVDLGTSPLCETFPTAEACEVAEPHYPLHLQVCEQCWLVQLPAYVPAKEIFAEYAYFSAYSDAWVEHARTYAHRMARELELGADSMVLEVASNDGYLLQWFVERGVPVLGVEPAANVAEAARERGVDTEVAFFDAAFGERLATEGRRADLIVANNVLAQVPDLNGFVAGFAPALAPDGVLTIEVPHLQRLIEGNQFDTIYHEHFTYFSLLALEAVLRAHGLHVYDVEELWTHGGSLRVFTQRADTGPRTSTPAVAALVTRERALGYDRADAYADFGAQVRRTKRRLLSYLIAAHEAGHRVVGYGAPGKSATLLNYCGIGPDLLEFTVDRNPYKHGRFTPGSRIPIHPVERLFGARPDVVLILPWNLADEIAAQLEPVRAWGGRLVVPIPEVTELTAPAGMRTPAGAR
ncbi:class I SAM-dependent methyltransferase [Egibacter rhizosphaerae]|uniref:Class I SAM-dependent methyltransferase n=1 Tax=Egibacter rhizosphaerae TaxID=1670831 RepID=A0A411YGC4_9ACTN|nr:class I SAM-dependent methyltransferase [Egibacter rhizosphaerae]QBI20290.1 class I SAM-dependent methyltransferase [Egibacter rhizosphaerae]